eukprot:CAMPEP_0179171312 /NCGR_PEP_ID=MMETSP0796-20121207/84442_1 /TAXON_ID=73915 /ORGANISM="Pyrodinium bahamense, Strain pbaha01" /LENGTH=113 /DNA_ID=CAMNT_0020874373 /DNA_START=11 /DNA_END=352 /DNA_ORIENTATION=+
MEAVTSAHLLALLLKRRLGAPARPEAAPCAARPRPAGIRLRGALRLLVGAPLRGVALRPAHCRVAPVAGAHGPVPEVAPLVGTPLEVIEGDLAFVAPHLDPQQRVPQSHALVG